MVLDQLLLDHIQDQLLLHQEHYLNAHFFRSIFATCSWSSMHFKYDPGAYLYDLEYSSRLLMVQEQLVLDHKSRPKSQKS